MKFASLSTENGGLGGKNKAFLSKWLWRFIDESIGYDIMYVCSIYGQQSGEWFTCSGEKGRKEAVGYNCQIKGAGVQAFYDKHRE